MLKYSAELKIAACQDYLSSGLTHKDVCEKYGIYYNTKKSTSELSKWIRRYLSHGENAFIREKGHYDMPATFKERVVLDYLSGKGSLVDIAAKYNLRSSSTLHRWVSLYNANRELKDYFPKREVYMAEARRKTTIEERKEIVEYCISHNRDYKGTASTYDVSYSQVYSWVKKYVANGDEGLTDKRGRHKSDEEVDELERLRRENARLKRQLEEKDMLTELLKKVQEFERM